MTIDTIEVRNAITGTTRGIGRSVIGKNLYTASNTITCTKYTPKLILDKKVTDFPKKLAGAKPIPIRHFANTYTAILSNATPKYL